jgi:hypothetical protein
LGVNRRRGWNHQLYRQLVRKLLRSYWCAPVVVIALALVWAVLWPLTDALAGHDIATVIGPGRAVHLQAAREAVRTHC